MKKFKYHWLHIPTGKTGAHIISEDELLKNFLHLTVNRMPDIYFAINYWNKWGRGIWQYWSES